MNKDIESTEDEIISKIHLVSKTLTGSTVTVEFLEREFIQIVIIWDQFNNMSTAQRIKVCVDLFEKRAPSICSRYTLMFKTYSPPELKEIKDFFRFRLH